MDVDFVTEIGIAVVKVVEIVYLSWVLLESHERDSVVVLRITFTRKVFVSVVWSENGIEGLTGLMTNDYITSASEVASKMDSRMRNGMVIGVIVGVVISRGLWNYGQRGNLLVNSVVEIVGEEDKEEAVRRSDKGKNRILQLSQVLAILGYQTENG